MKFNTSPFGLVIIHTYIHLLIDGTESLSRQGRSLPFLLFPRTSPTRVQIISGIGIPVALNFESVTIGYVFKAEYFLPENASNIINFFAQPFNPTPQPISSGRRKRRRVTTAIPAPTNDELPKATGYDTNEQLKFEKYDVEAIEVEYGSNDIKSKEGNDDYEYLGYDGALEGDVSNDPSDESDSVSTADTDDESEMPNDKLNNDVKKQQPGNMATARFSLYRGIEKMVARHGLEGRPCMLRSICEAAEAHFTHTTGILGELAHIIMTPSTTPDQVSEYADNEYLRAEDMGRAGAPCNKIFRECPVSILNKFSGIYNTMEGVIKMLG